MPEDHETRNPGSGRFSNDHKPKSLWTWVVPLAIVLAIIFFMPRLLTLFDYPMGHGNTGQV